GKLEDAAAPYFICGELSLDIAPGSLGGAGGGMHGVAKAAVLAEIALNIQLHRSEAQALFVELLGIEGQPGRTAADINMMGYRSREADQCLVIEDRSEDRNVLQMLAADIRIIGQEHLAWPDAAMLDKAGPHRQGERAHLHRNVLRLGNDPTLGVEQRTGAVAGLAYDCRAGRAQQIDP